MESKLFSVIIPVYNCADYLSRSVESVLKQSYPRLELILVDDGSTDGSEELCDEYSVLYKECRTIHQENRGPSAARNKGLNAATGDYICFLDADDYYEKNLLTRVSEEMETGVDICSFGARRVDEWEDDLYEMRFATGIGRVDFEKQDRRFYALNSFLQYEIGWEAWMQVYRHDFLEKNRIRFDESICYGEDKVFSAQCIAYAEKIVKLPDILYNYTARKGTLTEQFHQQNLINQGNFEFTYLWVIWENSGLVNRDKKYLVYIGTLYYYYTILLKSMSVEELRSCVNKSEQLQLQTGLLKKVLKNEKEMREAFGRKKSSEIHRLVAELLR